jgi:Zn-dependent alcohol dehydrogenase
VEDFIEILTLFKCRACDFTSGQKEPLCQHIQAAHLAHLSSQVL